MNIKNILTFLFIIISINFLNLSAAKEPIEPMALGELEKEKQEEEIQNINSYINKDEIRNLLEAIHQNKFMTIRALNECFDESCGLSRQNNNYRKFFENFIIKKFEEKKLYEEDKKHIYFTYAAFASGELFQDFVILNKIINKIKEITKNSKQIVLTVNLIDISYNFGGHKEAIDEFRNYFEWLDNCFSTVNVFNSAQEYIEQITKHSEKISQEISQKELIILRTRISIRETEADIEQIEQHKELEKENIEAQKSLTMAIEEKQQEVKDAKEYIKETEEYINFLQKYKKTGQSLRPHIITCSDFEFMLSFPPTFSIKPGTDPTTAILNFIKKNPLIVRPFENLVKNTLNKKGMFFNLHKLGILKENRDLYELPENNTFNLFYGSLNQLNQNKCSAIALDSGNKEFELSLNHIDTTLEILKNDSDVYYEIYNKPVFLEKRQKVEK